MSGMTESVTTSKKLPILQRRKKGSNIKEFFRMLAKNKGAVVAMIAIIVIVLACVFANLLSPYDYAKQDLVHKLAWPSLKHLCGTDNLGRDVFTRILYGGRISLLISLISVAFATVFGALIGAFSAYYGKLVDSVIMRILDVFMAIPGLLLSVTISSALGTGTINTAIALAVGSIPPIARIIRAQVLTINEQEFIEAARAAGASNARIIFTHIMPNSMAPLIVQATLRIGSAVLLISSLSFLGAGIQPPTPEWGAMLNAGRAYIRTFWPIIVFPGIAIMITMLTFNVFGDGVRDALDPKLKR